MNYYLLTTTDNNTYAMVAKTPKQAQAQLLDMLGEDLDFATIELTTKQIADEYFN